MRPYRALALLAVSLVLVACSSSGTPAPSGGGASSGAAATTVNITDAASPGKFEPASVTIKVGQTVQFLSQSNAAHTVQWDGSKFPTSAVINKGDAGYTTPAFTTAGTFNYICGIHGASMSGSIVVQP
jgi:plastocyanin